MARQLLDPGPPTVDRGLRGVVLVMLLALAAYAAVPGAAQELTPRLGAVELAGIAPSSVTGRVVPPIAAFEIPGVPHTPAQGLGSWVLVVCVVVVMLAGGWERFRREELLGALLAAATVAPLAAGRWEASVAAASALRWTSAAVLLGASGLIWSRERLSAGAGRLGWRFGPSDVSGLAALATATVLALALLPLMLMAAYVGTVALRGRGIGDDLAVLWMAVGVIFVVLGAVGFALRAAAGRNAADEGTAWRSAGMLLIVLGMLPLVAVTVFAVGSTLVGNPIVGPEPDSFFGRIGQAGSYVPPMLVIAATLVGFAVRERSSGFAFSAGLTLSLAATVGYLLGGVPGGLRLDAALWVRLAQLNALVGSGYALAWMAAVARDRRRSDASGPAAVDGLLDAQVALGMVLNLLVLGAGAVLLFVNPVPGRVHEVIAGPWGWAAFGLAAAAVVARSRVLGRPIAPDAIGLGSVAATILLALGLAFRDTGDWRTYHGLMAGLTVAGFGWMVVIWHRSGLRLATVREEVRAAVVRWEVLVFAAVVLLALRAYDGSDPHSPWWTVGGLLVMAPLAAALARWAIRPGWLAWPRC